MRPLPPAVPPVERVVTLAPVEACVGRGIWKKVADPKDSTQNTLRKWVIAPNKWGDLPFLWVVGGYAMWLAGLFLTVAFLWFKGKPKGKPPC